MNSTMNPTTTTPIDFDTFINTGWAEHAEQPDAVAARLHAELDRPTSAAERKRFARLVSHVYGEHLGRWSDGIALLDALGRQGEADSGVATLIRIETGALRHAGELAPDSNALSAEENIDVLASAAGMLAGQRRFRRAIESYDAALAQARSGLPTGSSATRSLAIAGNNLASALEEKTDRDEVETGGMLRAAEGGLHYWKLAGTWLEEERAEYRLCRSLLQAGQVEAAVDTAKRCVAVCLANDAPAFELFFGYAVLAMAQGRSAKVAGFESARAEALRQYALVSPDEQAWCKTDLAELPALAPSPSGRGLG